MYNVLFFFYSRMGLKKWSSKLCKMWDGRFEKIIKPLCSVRPVLSLASSSWSSFVGGSQCGSQCGSRCGISTVRWEIVCSGKKWWFQGVFCSPWKRNLEIFTKDLELMGYTILEQSKIPPEIIIKHELIIKDSLDILNTFYNEKSFYGTKKYLRNLNKLYI